MTKVELLRGVRDKLLRLHKALVDFERGAYEREHGTTTSGEFLNALLNDAKLGWLRRFSTLIVDIDEMFAQKDGFSEEAVNDHLDKARDLTLMRYDEEFNDRYRDVLQQDQDAAALHAELRTLIAGES